MTHQGFSGDIEIGHELYVYLIDGYRATLAGDVSAAVHFCFKLSFADVGISGFRIVFFL